MILKELAFGTLVAVALFSAASCGPKRISLKPTSQKGTFAVRLVDEVYTCTNYTGSSSSRKLARNKNKMAALDKIDRRNEQIDEGRDSYPVSGDLCTTYYVD